MTVQVASRILFKVQIVVIVTEGRVICNLFSEFDERSISLHILTKFHEIWTGASSLYTG